MQANKQATAIPYCTEHTFESDACEGDFKEKAEPKQAHQAVNGHTQLCPNIAIVLYPRALDSPGSWRRGCKGTG